MPEFIVERMCLGAGGAPAGVAPPAAPTIQLPPRRVRPRYEAGGVYRYSREGLVSACLALGLVLPEAPRLTFRLSRPVGARDTETGSIDRWRILRWAEAAISAPSGREWLVQVTTFDSNRRPRTAAALTKHAAARINASDLRHAAFVLVQVDAVDADDSASMPLGQFYVPGQSVLLPDPTFPRVFTLEGTELAPPLEE